ncbi:MAG: metallophosphoesterase [Bdellovibrionota bacterium]
MARKLKLVISDLHLGNGRTLKGGGTNPLEEFYFGQKLVEFLHYYCSGEFRDAEVELIINGDFLNFLQVDYRGHHLTVITESVSLEKMKYIVQGHKEVFEALKTFATTPGRSVTYVVGNHDQCMLWPATRAYFNEVLQTSVKFKNLVYFFDGVHIEHGHMHEAANRFDPKRFFLKKNLPEPILNLPFGSHFFVDFVLKLKQVHPHVDKVRPFKRMIRWAIVNEFWFTFKSFIKLTKYFLDAIFVSDPRRQFPVKRILKVLAESAIFPDLSESARRILNDERVNIVIFGHTHVYQYRQWGADKEYFNTGTWTDITSLDIPSLGKITKLTYVILEYPETVETTEAKDGEVVEPVRPRGRLKEWRGYHRIEEDVAVS